MNPPRRIPSQGRAAARSNLPEDSPLRFFSLVSIVLLAVALTACSSAAPTGAPSAAASAGGSDAAATEAASVPAPAEATVDAQASASSDTGTGTEVSIVDFGFEPQDVDVTTGGTVVWTHDGSALHTVKWEDGEPESEQLNAGDTYERTFDAAGSFPYVCGLHPTTMTGTITVSE